MAHTPGPCPWPVGEICSDMPDADERDDDEQAMYERLLAVATETLWRASGRRYGLCPVQVRPARPECAPGCPGPVPYGSASGWAPFLDSGVWHNCYLGARRPSAVWLPGHVNEVLEVRIGNSAILATTYRVDDHAWLVRQDGQAWPEQDLSRPLGAPGTWSVSYTYGLPVGPLGQHALAVYLCELWKAATGAVCRLPTRIEGIFRQGVNIDFADDNLDLLSKGRTGVPEVDTWLALVNPVGATGPSQVYSVDLPFVRTVHQEA